MFPLFLVNACADDSPETPEEVIRTWQDYMDRNDFEAAKNLSTPEGKIVISNIEELLSFDNEPIPVDTTDFVSLTCVENGNEAVCRYTERLKEETIRRGNELITIEEEMISDSFMLKKIDGAWRVDLSDEPVPNEKELKEMFKEILEEENS